LEKVKHTVDGSEIPNNQVIWKICQLYMGLIHPNGGWPWDFSVVSPNAGEFTHGDSPWCKVKRHEFNKSKGFHNLKASTSQGINIWVFPKMALPPFHTPKWSFLVGKPIVVGYHHFRKPLYPTKGIIIFKSADWNRICCFRFKKM